MDDTFTVKVLVTGRLEAIVYEDVWETLLIDGYLKIYNKQGYASIPENRIDEYQDTYLKGIIPE